jgi:hypothetical protein
LRFRSCHEGETYKYCEHKWGLPPTHCKTRNGWPHWPIRICRIQAAEEAFDRLTRMVTRLLGVPVSLVSLVDDRRQFFKSQQGLQGAASEARQTPLSHSFCQHVVIEQALLVVTDAENDPRVRENLTRHSAAA